MPLAKVHLLEGQYDSARIGQLSKAIQDALIEVLDIPPDDFFQIHHVLPAIAIATRRPLLDRNTRTT
jgi:Tautomerase enzyme